MEPIQYPFVSSPITPLSEADNQGVFLAQTSVGKLRLIVSDKDTIFATDYWICDCGHTYKRSKVNECPDCLCSHENESDALVEDVENLLNPT